MKTIKVTAELKDFMMCLTFSCGCYLEKFFVLGVYPIRRGLLCAEHGAKHICYTGIDEIENNPLPLELQKALEEWTGK